MPETSGKCAKASPSVGSAVLTAAMASAMTGRSGSSTASKKKDKDGSDAGEKEDSSVNGPGPSSWPSSILDTTCDRCGGRGHAAENCSSPQDCGRCS